MYIPFDPPFGCQISAPKRFGLFLAVFWGSNFRPNWRIQVGFLNISDMVHMDKSSLPPGESDPP